LKHNTEAVPKKVDRIFDIMRFKDGYEDIHRLNDNMKRRVRLKDLKYKESNLQTIFRGTLGNEQATTQPRTPGDCDIAYMEKK
jgi:alcohol dehydrogenase class IV